MAEGEALAMKAKKKPHSNLCEVCGNPHSFYWTDTHGVGQCFTCGVPYTIYHYDGNRRLEKPPELAVKPEYVQVLRAYWNETKHRIPGGYSFPGGDELATQEDHTVFHEWMDKNAEKLLAHNR